MWITEELELARVKLENVNVNNRNTVLAWRKTGTKLVKYGATQTWRQEYDVTNIKL